MGKKDWAVIDAVVYHTDPGSLFRHLENEDNTDQPSKPVHGPHPNEPSGKPGSLPKLLWHAAVEHFQFRAQSDRFYELTMPGVASIKNLATMSSRIEEQTGPILKALRDTQDPGLIPGTTVAVAMPDHNDYFQCDLPGLCEDENCQDDESQVAMQDGSHLDLSLQQRCSTSRLGPAGPGPGPAADLSTQLQPIGCQGPVTADCTASDLLRRASHRSRG